MKIAISTLVGYFNYGNRLQNFALQEVLKDLGNDVYTIRDHTNIVNHESTFDKLKRILLTEKFFEKFKKLINWKKRRKNRELNILRENEFKKFTKRYIKETDFFIDQNTKKFSFDKEFDCYVIGSDQVWNYDFDTFSDLSFVSYSKKPKISYAASFGVSHIPDRLREQYCEGLKGIDFLSVREDVGKDIIKDITGRKSIVVLDPTLLLSRNRWEDLISDNKDYDERYVVVYFLGEISEEDKLYIKKFALNNNCEIKNLHSIKSQNIWISDPSEFVNLISQSQAIFTDSFHGSVFSIIFEKYFEVFSRNGKGPSMNSRIDTLLNDLELSDRWHSNINSNVKPNYANSIKKLKTRRQESISFLKDSLSKVESTIND